MYLIREKHMKVVEEQMNEEASREAKESAEELAGSGTHIVDAGSHAWFPSAQGTCVGVCVGAAVGAAVDRQRTIDSGSGWNPSRHLHWVSMLAPAASSTSPASTTTQVVLLSSHPWVPSAQGATDGACVGVCEGKSGRLGAMAHVALIHSGW